jgi:CRP-like cAMP-binding protein
MVESDQTHSPNAVWTVTWKFEDDSFDTLKAVAETHEYKAGACVFSEGDRADGMYLILSGKAAIVRKTRSGYEKTVNVVGDGQSFGELGLLIDRPRQASIIAQTDLTVLKITRYVLDVLHGSAPDMALMMYRMLARSLAEQLLNTQEMQPPD